MNTLSVIQKNKKRAFFERLRHLQYDPACKAAYGGSVREKKLLLEKKLCPKNY